VAFEDFVGVDRLHAILEVIHGNVRDAFAFFDGHCCFLKNGGPSR